MTQRVQVPRFGNWEAENTIPYTVYFDRAVGGRVSGEMITPSSHDLGKHCIGSSPARAHPYNGKEKSSEELQPNWEVPTFGDWDGQGDDVQYTVYFEKVCKRGSRGHTAHENDPQSSNCAENACPPARKVPVEYKSPQHQKGKKNGVPVHEEPKQELTSRFRGSLAASSEGHKKIPSNRSPSSKHSIDGSTARVPDHKTSSEMKSRVPQNSDMSDESRSRANPPRNEVVVPDTLLGSWNDSDPSQVSSKHRNGALQSAIDRNSSYNKSPTKIKETNANTCCFPWGRK